MSNQNTRVSLDFELPKTVEALRAGRLATFQGAATVSALLSGIEAGLLVFFKDETNFGAKDGSCRCNDPDWIQTNMQKAILTLTYLSLVLSLGVTVTSYALIAEFSALPVLAAKDPLLVNSPPNFVQMSNWDILRYYRLKKHTPCLYKYWSLSLMLSVVFAVLSIGLFIGDQEDTKIKIVPLVFVGLFIVPVASMVNVWGGE